MSQALPAEALNKLRRFVERSKRSSSVRFPVSFVRSQLDSATPTARPSRHIRRCPPQHASLAGIDGDTGPVRNLRATSSELLRPGPCLAEPRHCRRPTSDGCSDLAA